MEFGSTGFLPVQAVKRIHENNIDIEKCTTNIADY